MHVLLRCGADPNAVDCDGHTALHWAAVGGNGRCISLLLMKGADICTRDAERWMAQDVADEFRTRDAWDGALVEMGLRDDGTKVPRPLSEVRPCWFFVVWALMNGGAPVLAPCEDHRLLSS